MEVLLLPPPMVFGIAMASWWLNMYNRFLRDYWL